MKKNIKNPLYLFLFLLSALIGCNSDPEYYSLDVPGDQMKLQASSDSMVLERANADKEAFKFTHGNKSKIMVEGF